MHDVLDQGCHRSFIQGRGIDTPGSSTSFAGPPILTRLVGQSRLNQLKGLPGSIMSRLPDPTGFPGVRHPRPGGPLSLIMITHLINLLFLLVNQSNSFPAIAQRTRPSAGNLINCSVNGRKFSRIGSHHQESSGRDGEIRKGEADPIGETPVLHPHGAVTDICQFKKFVGDIPTFRVVHDLIDHDRIGSSPNLDSHLAGTRTQGPIAHPVGETVRPRESRRMGVSE